jgi:trehalose 6-phosphate synthase
VFPIGIDAAPFREDAAESADVAGLRIALGDRRLVLGVDRLDYSKGVPERLLAYECLLERWPEYRRRIAFVQVSVPSRAEIPEYAEIRARVESLVGRINGRFGEADWVPVRYLYRSFSQQVLAQLYRLADVALVTPLRDGMNLVAKEFVVAQDPARPGVLVLSQFAGAAEQLAAAVLANPYHPNGLAADLDYALRMPLTERIPRHRMLSAAIERGGDATTWATTFLDRLEHVVSSEAALDRQRLTAGG